MEKAIVGTMDTSLYISNILRLFSDYFITNYSNYNDIISNSNNSSTYINATSLQKIDEYLGNNISNVINIDELAKLINMSKFHFLNEFKKVKEQTPYQYILTYKITKAKTLLEDLALSITEIAQALGFNDSSHFSRSFKAATSFTPKAYRKNL